MNQKQPLKRLTQLKLDRILKLYGFNEAELTPDELLEFAICAEQTCKDVGPFDPAFSHFKQQQLDFEAAAGYLEEVRRQANINVAASS